MDKESFYLEKLNNFKKTYGSLMQKYDLGELNKMYDQVSSISNYEDLVEFSYKHIKPVFFGKEYVIDNLIQKALVEYPEIKEEFSEGLKHKLKLYVDLFASL